MCLVALAIDQAQRFPLVVAANRDEYFKRPTARLAWWSPGDGLPDILSGRDLEAGGTWFGITAAGRMALLTNVREPGRNQPDAPSRGSLVPLWLAGEMSSDRYWPRAVIAGHNGFNLIAADFRMGECFYLSNRGDYPQRLERGLYGLSNAALDTPWPKVDRLKLRLRAALGEADTVGSLCESLFAALADREIPPDEQLPATGVPLAWERLLAPAMIRTPHQAYGTRCSTVMITERTKRRLITHVFERSFSVDSNLALVRHSVLDDWPPKYAANGSTGGPVTTQQQVSESSVAIDAAALTEPPVRKRVRSLLKPEPARRRRKPG